MTIDGNPRFDDSFFNNDFLDEIDISDVDLSDELVLDGDLLETSGDKAESDQLDVSTELDSPSERVASLCRGAISQNLSQDQPKEISNGSSNVQNKRSTAQSAREYFADKAMVLFVKDEAGNFHAYSGQALDKVFDEQDVSLDNNTILGTEQKGTFGERVFKFPKSKADLIAEAIESGTVYYHTGGGGDPIVLDPSRVTVSAMTEDEYQMFQQIVLPRFQELADFHKALKVSRERAEAGEQQVDPSRFKVILNDVKGHKDTDSTDKKDQEENKARLQAIKQRQIDDISTAEAQKRKHQQQEIEKIERALQDERTGKRNREGAVNKSIEDRSIKQIGHNQPVEQKNGFGMELA